MVKLFNLSEEDIEMLKKAEAAFWENLGIDSEEGKREFWKRVYDEARKDPGFIAHRYYGRYTIKKEDEKNGEIHPEA